MSALNSNNPNGGGAGVGDIGPILSAPVSKDNPNQQPEVGKAGNVGSKGVPGSYGEANPKPKAKGWTY